MRYQRARLQYQYNKLKPIQQGIYPEYGGNIEFELFAFFEICYHLKDWVKFSQESQRYSDIESFINASPALRICADICNRLKHSKLSKRRSNSNIGIFKISSSITIPMSEGEKNYRVRIEAATIETERGAECCFALADECMKEWDKYFKTDELIAVPPNKSVNSQP